MSDHTDLHPDISWPFTNLKYVTQHNWDIQSTVTYLLQQAYVFTCYIITSVSLKYNFFRVSSLAYPNLLGKKGYVVVVVVLSLKR